MLYTLDKKHESCTGQDGARHIENWLSDDGDGVKKKSDSKIVRAQLYELVM